MESIVEKIKDIRKRKGYSHEYMAHQLEMSQPAYSKIEKNKPNFIHKINYLFITATVADTIKLIDNFNKFYSFF